MAGGWVKLHRVLMDKPIWTQSTPEQKVILVTLLMMASHEKNSWEWGGKQFKIQPGQFVTSLERIAQKAGQGISIKNVRTGIARFKKMKFLANESAKHGRLITVINWDSYQVDIKEGWQSIGQEGGKKVATIKKYKNKRSTYSAEFEQFWEAYPRRVNKGQAWKTWNKMNGERPSLEVLRRSIESHKKTRDWLKDGGQFIPHPSTWLNARGWEDEITPVTGAPKHLAAT